MSAEIIVLNMPTTLDIPPDRVLDGALGQLESVVLIGTQPDGELYLAASMADKATMNWLLDRLKFELLKQ